jgi:hypothetical protein
MASWMVNIVAGQNPGDPATFVPQLQQPGPGGALQASKGDIVAYFNATDDAHQPWPTDSNFVPLPDASVPRQSTYYLSDQIAAKHSSRPSWVAFPPTSAMSPDGKTLFYCCKLHPNEHGAIIVT